MPAKQSTSKFQGRREPTFTLADLTRATAQLSLHRFRDTHGSFSGETAQKMMRLELAIELERLLLWGHSDDDTPKAA